MISRHACNNHDNNNNNYILKISCFVKAHT